MISFFLKKMLHGLSRERGFGHSALAGSFPSRMSAAFSAIAMMAALVLPRTIEGRHRVFPPFFTDRFTFPIGASPPISNEVHFLTRFTFSSYQQSTAVNHDNLTGAVTLLHKE